MRIINEEVNGSPPRIPTLCGLSIMGYHGVMMLSKIISGHQTGADIATIDVAMANGFPCGGWVPKGRKTENGPLPDIYIVQEMSTGAYPKRTEKNMLISDGAVIFSHGQLTGGSDLTRKLALKHGKPWLHIDFTVHDAEAAVALLSDFIAENAVAVLNVAGPRSSGDPKIYDAVYRVVTDLI